MSGTQTEAYKLADRVGTLDTAIEELKVSAGLKIEKYHFSRLQTMEHLKYEL